jgi:hypothetical protein
VRRTPGDEEAADAKETKDSHQTRRRVEHVLVGDTPVPAERQGVGKEDGQRKEEPNEVQAVAVRIK